MYKNIGAIVLAAGKGKRMKSKTINKVALSIGNRPMIVHEIEFLKSLGISKIVVVVGFAKDSVKNALKNKQVTFALQKKQLGTAHAVLCALPVVSKDINTILVIQGDDAVFYCENNKKLIESLIEKHIQAKASITFLTLDVQNPFGLGRIVRDKKADVIGIVEEKDATTEQRKICEINPACYIFAADFLRKYLKNIKKSTVTGEYYLVDLVSMASKHHEKIETVRAQNSTWRGVNTKEELRKAQHLHMDRYN